jgi:hypothetical protein
MVHTSSAATTGTMRYRGSPCAEVRVSADLTRSIDGIVTLKASLDRTWGAVLGIRPLRISNMIPEHAIASLKVALSVRKNISVDISGCVKAIARTTVLALLGSGARARALCLSCKRPCWTPCLQLIRTQRHERTLIIEYGMLVVFQALWLMFLAEHLAGDHWVRANHRYLFTDLKISPSTKRTLNFDTLALPALKNLVARIRATGANAGSYPQHVHASAASLATAASMDGATKLIRGSVCAPPRVLTTRIVRWTGRWGTFG